MKVERWTDTSVAWYRLVHGTLMLLAQRTTMFSELPTSREVQPTHDTSDKITWFPWSVNTNVCGAWLDGFVAIVQLSNKMVEFRAPRVKQGRFLLDAHWICMFRRSNVAPSPTLIVVTFNVLFWTTNMQWFGTTI
jgi:hypothetical protein